MPSEAFAAAVLNPKSDLPDSVKGNVPRRFAVYRNNVMVGLIGAMETNFPAVHRLLGEEYFRGLARQFVLANPPQNPLMFQYGGVFPEYLNAQADLAVYPYLADVAKLECLMRQAHHAEDAQVLKPEALAALAPDELSEVVFKPHAALQLLASDFAVVSITRANRTGGSSQVAQPLQSECAMVTRPQYDVVITVVTKSQLVFLQSLSEGKPLAEAADAAIERDAEFDLSVALGILLSNGAFTSIQL
jgi:hypothetical protein